jgi:hypothetical protein
MPDSPNSDSFECSFHIKDYIDAAHDAARGTRIITIVLVVACVLVAIGYWNSFHTSWQHVRINNAFDPDDMTIYGGLDLAERPKLWPNLLFDTEDFSDFPALARKLVGKTDPLSEYLYSNLSRDTKEALAKCTATNNTTEECLHHLATDLNKLMLEGKPLYDRRLFEKAPLRAETRQLLALEPGGRQLVRLNRMLLEDAYCDEIAKSYVHIGQSPAGAYRKEIQQQVVRTYVENVRLIKAPFFGIAFDVNDLGLIGGVGFIIILLLLRHSLSREIKSLRRSFAAALSGGRSELHHFYHVLAIRQVFTVPEMEGEIRNRFLAKSQKIIVSLPVLVFLMAVYYDYRSVTQLKLFPWQFVSWQIEFEILMFWAILYLSVKCLERLKTIDKTWKENWEILQSKNSRIILLDEI